MTTTTTHGEQQLATKTAEYTRRGWRVEAASSTMVTLAKGKRPNHVLHLLLTVFTVGVWGLVWAWLAIVKHERRVTLTVIGDTVQVS